MKISRRDFVVGAPLALAFSGAARAQGVEIRSGKNGLSVRAGRSVLTRNARPFLAWRFVGETEWRSSFADRVESRHSNSGFSLSAQFAECRSNIEGRPDGPNAWTLNSALTHTGKRAIELARFHLLDGSPEDPSLALLMLQGLSPQRLVRAGERVAPFATGLTDLWASMKVRWTTLVDPVYGAADWALSRDIGFLASDWHSSAWGAGFAGPGLAFGEIGLRTQGAPRFFIGQVLDNILFEPGEVRPMDTAILWHGDWQDGIKDWVRRCAVEFGVTRPPPAPVGYCSWYQVGQQVEVADIERAAREFAAWPKPPGGRLIQIDDGYQIMPGNWQPNAKFAGRWQALAASIASSGSIPGTYLAPTTIHESHPLVKSQPQMLQRMTDGSLPISFANWRGNTYYVDPDHPQAVEFVRKFFVDARSEGWKYIKIDFTYGISTARAAYDRKLTSFQSHRNLYRLFRESAGPEMLLNGCIGEPGRYALGFVQAARIGGDINTKWPTVKANLINVLLFAPTNGVWWQADPDVFYMRREKSELSAEESFVLMGTLGLMGGVFLTSDFPSQWSAEAQALVREFWNEAGPQAPIDQRIVVGADGVMKAYRVSYADGQRIRHRIALYNWSDAPQSLQVLLTTEALVPASHSWKVEDKIYSKGISLAQGAIVSQNQPAHSLRIADLSD